MHAPHTPARFAVVSSNSPSLFWIYFWLLRSDAAPPASEKPVHCDGNCDERCPGSRSICRPRGQGSGVTWALAVFNSGLLDFTADELSNGKGLLASCCSWDACPQVAPSCWLLGLLLLEFRNQNTPACVWTPHPLAPNKWFCTLTPLPASLLDFRWVFSRPR